MKTMRLMLVIAVVMSAFGFSFSEAYASGPFTCTVVSAGPATSLSNGTKYRINLTDDGGTFSNKAFYPVLGYEKDMLAVALTALANGKKVKIWTEGTTTRITIMYILN